MAEYLTYHNMNLYDIKPQDRPGEGEVFICDNFHSFGPKFVVGRDNGVKDAVSTLGLFWKYEHAKIFAEAL